MATLQPIPNVTRLSEHVIRILGQNPGRFTLQGTNTYLVGRSKPYILIDTAEGREEFTPILESVLLSEANSTDPSVPEISDIVISHWHHDHVGGLPAVLSLLRRLWSGRNPSTPFPGPRLHKFPLPAPTSANDEALRKWNILPKILQDLPPELYTPSPSGSPLHELTDAQVIQGTAASLHVHHTPGHTLDSISIYIPEDRALYTADTVLGHGTAVFEDLSLYLSSLDRMLRFGTGSGPSPPSSPNEAEPNDDNTSSSTINLDYVSLYPSHGPVVANGRETISMYINHRLEREGQVFQLVSAAPAPAPDTHWTTWAIVKNLYASYPEAMWMPAMRSIDLHLRKLEGDGRIKKLSGEGQDAKWVSISRTPTPSL